MNPDWNFEQIGIGGLDVEFARLPNEEGRIRILNIHTSRMRENKKLSDDVDINELAMLTENFSGPEIECLVRAAQSWALSRLVKMGSKVEVDPDAIKKLMLTRKDFMYALEKDVKPAFGSTAEHLQNFLRKEIVAWGEPVRRLLKEGDFLIQQAKSASSTGVVSVLLHGPANSGKTAMAAKIAKSSDFPFIKVLSPKDMICYTESTKCIMLKKAFDDSYKSPLSVLLIDSLERLFDYSPIGPIYSNSVLQALLALLKEPPPPGTKLLILATTSLFDVMNDLGVVSAFGTVLKVRPLKSGEEVVKALKKINLFTPEELTELKLKLGKRRMMHVGLENF